VDNTTHEDKNIYIFAKFTTPMGLEYFKEVQLCFLIVGHTYKDNDQHFNIILNTLKKMKIDWLKEFLQLLKRWSNIVYRGLCMWAHNIWRIWGIGSFFVYTSFSNERWYIYGHNFFHTTWDSIWTTICLKFNTITSTMMYGNQWRGICVYNPSQAH